jgi:tetratricopeptide (TPR) repeat protein
MRRLVLLSALLLVMPQATPARASYAYVLQHHPTSTQSAAAQLCFDRGLTLFYAYARLASRRAFECAAKADPSFAMAYWGIALAYGSNINFIVDQAGEKAAYAAIHRALAMDARAPAAEQAYIRALASRYSKQPKPDFGALAVSYKNAMAELMRRYPDDPDAATLYVEAMMELQPWQLYAPGGQPLGSTNEIVATLESVLAREPQNIAANHFYIHAVESSHNPQRGLPSAARLQAMQFEPAAAHLGHMPAHIYMRTGDFALAAQINEHASMHDIAYLHGAGEPDSEFVSGYHDHNLSMLAAAYSAAGSWVNAKRIAGMLTSEGALVPAMFVYLRFERWDEILRLPEPKADSGEPDAPSEMRLPIWHFARGMAFASNGRVSEAKSELSIVRNAQKELNIPAWPGTWNSSGNLLAIASDVLAAKIATASGVGGQAVDLLRSAVKAQDNLLYIEPPDWYFPVRESLGGALFGRGDFAEAAEVFRADLERNARNPRSLFGLYRSLLAQGKDADAAWVWGQFSTAWKDADAELKMSDL